jgi:hypothetical protein
MMCMWSIKLVATNNQVNYNNHKQNEISEKKKEHTIFIYLVRSYNFLCLEETAVLRSTNTKSFVTKRFQKAILRINLQL